LVYQTLQSQQLSKKLYLSFFLTLFQEVPLLGAFDATYNNNHLPVKKYKIKFITKIEILKIVHIKSSPHNSAKEYT